MYFKSTFTVCILLCCAKFISAGFFEGEYYFSYPTKGDWWEASRFCTFYGMYLIDIRDSTEHENIKNEIGKLVNASRIVNEQIWTSGVRFNDEPRYYWETTGMPVIYSDWETSQPTFASDKCFFLTSNKLQFYDTICTVKLTFICRKTIMKPYKECMNYSSLLV